jgi:hypothetical protein
MGFVFNLFVVFILFPLLCILFIFWVISKKKVFGKTITSIIVGLFSLILLYSVLRIITGKKILDKDDYHGSYTINKNYFPGKQANWQYDNFRFEIKDNDSIYFYVTDKANIRQTYKGIISTVKRASSERLVLHMQQPTHHVLTTNPTIYRSVWSFELVFNSPKFNNMYFTKGKWGDE